MSLTKTRGVVLRTINIREADRIIEIYSDDLGKVRAIARGVRKIQSRLAGHLEPFTYVDLMFAQGRGELPTITGAKALEHFEFIRRDLHKVAVASYLSELVGKLTPDNQVSRRFPELLRTAFKALDADHDTKLVASYFEWHAITVAGWEPNLYACASCHQPLYPPDLAFSHMFTGVLCGSCRSADREAATISAEAVKLLRFNSERSFSEVAGLLVTDHIRQEVRRLTELIVYQTLEREPRSKAFMRHLETV